MASKKDIKSGLAWGAIDSFGGKLVGIIIGIVLAKKIGPSAYGLIGMIAIFMAISIVLVNSGFGSALIRKLDRNERDYSTVFYVSLIVSLACYTILYSLAPYISDFYKQKDLILIIRWVSVSLVINSLSIIPKVLLTLRLDFKTQAKCNIFSLVVSGSVAIILAYSGFGVWSLVTQQVLSSIINVLVLNIVNPWKPKTGFCYESFQGLFRFSSGLILTGLLGTIYNNIYNVIIGKYYSPLYLGLFTQARNLSSVPVTTMATIIEKVSYPLLSSMQKDKSKLDEAYLTIIKLSCFFIFPLMMGLCIISEPLVYLLLGVEWGESAKFISILSMGLLLYPINIINLNILKVKARTDILFKLEVIKKLTLTLFLFFTFDKGLSAICFIMVVYSYFELAINIIIIDKFTSITPIKQLRIIFSIFVFSLFSAGSSYLIIDGLIEVPFLKALCMLIFEVVVYLSIMFIFQNKMLSDIIKLLKEKNK